MVVDVIERDSLVEEKTLPENTVVDYEHAGIYVHMVHVNKIGHHVHELAVHQRRKQFAFDVGEVVSSR